MSSIADSALNDQLTRLGAFDFFRKASAVRNCSFVTGSQERVVTIGEDKTYLINKGLVALDPLQKENYNPILARELSQEHFLTAAIPFSPTAPFKIVVPKLALVFSQYGPVEITYPESARADAYLLLREILTTDTTTFPHKSLSLEVIEDESPIDFQIRVAKAIETIATSDLDKVVISKTVHLKGERPENSTMIFDKLVYDRPYTHLFSMTDYLGASPELVVARKGPKVTSYPLAGTANSEDEALLLLSEKDNQEHQIVVQQIITRLNELGIAADPQSKPAITRYGEMVHLGSKISGSEDPARPFTSIELAAHLSPTAAINGEPYDSAMKYIASHEPSDRGLYGGLIGYQKNGGDGSWILNIRSIQLFDDGLTLRAGVGIVDKSDPVQEDLEATSKINAIASCLLE